MSCECFQQWLLIERREKEGNSAACGFIWGGAGIAFDGARRKQTITEEWENGTVHYWSEYTEQIVTGLDSCDLPTDTDDYVDGFDYGNFLSVEYTYEFDYDPLDVLAAADGDGSWGSWVTHLDLKASGSQEVFEAQQPYNNGASSVVRGWHYCTYDQSTSMVANSIQGELRFTLKGPKLPCRVDYRFTDGTTGSVDLDGVTPEQTVTVPMPSDGDSVGAAGDSPPEVQLAVLKVFFTPWQDALTGGTADATTDKITLPNHGLETEDAVTVVSATGMAGITPGETYYAIKVSASEIKLATSAANAAANTAIDITSAGSAIHLLKL